MGSWRARCGERRWLHPRAVAPLVPLPNPGADQQDQRDRAVEGQLDRVPPAQQHYKVEPAGAAGLDGRDAPVGGEEVRDREKHHVDAPAKASSGAGGGDEEIGGRVAEDAVGVDAGRPDEPEHGHSPSRGSATRT